MFLYRIKFFRALLLLQFAFSFAASAKDRMQVGFERLELHDYFKAREIFLKSIKSDPVPAYYGLSIICSRDNNPFYDLDSARSYVLRADSIFRHLTSEEEQKIKDKFHITSIQINNRKDTIASIAFRATAKENTVESWNKFIGHYNYNTLSDSATFLRNQLAFSQAVSENTSAGWQRFLDQYPFAIQKTEALQRYEDVFFSERTQAGTEEAYAGYISAYPQSPYRLLAEDSLYAIATAGKTPDEYYEFAKKYPDNKNTNAAWMSLYHRYTEINEIKNLDVFFGKYPDFPFKKRASDDFRLASVTLLPVKKNNRFTFFTESGKQAIAAVYDDVDEFSEGLCAVSQNGKYGYISKTGKVEIAFQFEEADPFENGYAIVKMKGKYTVINRDGAPLFEAKYKEVGLPSDERILFLDSSLYGYLDMKGEIVIPPVYETAYDFVKGRAAAGGEEKFGLIDRYGRWIAKPVYTSVSIEENGLVKVESDERYGLLNRSGSVILPVEYDMIGVFYNNLAMVVKNDRLGYINSSGKIVIPLEYDYYEPAADRAEFREGYAEVYLKGKKLLINSAGEKVIGSIYEDLRFYGSTTLVAARKRGKWGFIDLENNVVIPFSYDQVNPFSELLASVRMNKVMGVIDTTGKMVIQPRYDFISGFRNGVAVVRKDKLFGLISKYGSLLVAPEYEKYNWMTETVIRLDRNDHYGYYNTHLKQWIWKEDGF